MIQQLAKAQRGRPAKYPWESWTDGRIHSYVSEKPESFISALRYQAKTRKLNCTAVASGTTVKFQFLPRRRKAGAK